MKLAIFQKLLLQTLQALQCSLKLIYCNSKTAPRSADLFEEFNYYFEIPKWLCKSCSSPC